MSEATDQHGYAAFGGNYYWVLGTRREDVKIPEYSQHLKIYQGRRCVAEYRLRADRTHNHQRWYMDFVSDCLAGGRSIRALTLVEDYTRGCLAIEVQTSLGRNAGAAHTGERDSPARPTGGDRSG